MKPNEVVKMSLCPVRASCSIERSASAPSGTFSRYVRVDLVSERLHHRLAADVVLIGPAEIADRADIDEADLELVGGRGVEGHGGEPCGRGHGEDDPFVHDLHSGLAETEVLASAFSFTAARNARSTFNTVARDGEPPSGPTLSFEHDLFRKPFSISGACSAIRHKDYTEHAGAADPAVPRVREINTRTITVAR